MIDDKDLTPVEWKDGEWRLRDNSRYGPGIADYVSGKTPGIIPLLDAIRAYRDRPSMEAELTALRDKCQRYEAALREIEDHTCEPGYYDMGFKTLQEIAANALKGEGG